MAACYLYSFRQPFTLTPMAIRFLLIPARLLHVIPQALYYHPGAPAHFTRGRVHFFTCFLPSGSGEEVKMIENLTVTFVHN